MTAEPVPLRRRDRLAFAWRMGGTALGVAALAWFFFSEGWRHGEAFALVAAVIVGGALVYHLLTSVVRCPSCEATVVNLAIADSDVKRKLFHCSRCGANASLTEGFYWQQDVSG